MPTVTDDIHAALAVLQNGGVVAIPTETVYGLAADADNDAAIRRVFKIKGRPEHHPLIVHCSSLEIAAQYGVLNDNALALVSVLWPGPLTIIVPRQPRSSDFITGGRDTVALRIPSHPLTLQLLEEFERGLVAPSANRFGMVSPTSAQHVTRDLDDDVDLILDGGVCEIGVESTIVDCTTNPIQILRPGAITAEDIESILRITPESASGPSRAPGMMISHYAPRCAVEMFNSPAEAAARDDELRTRGLSTRIVDRSDDAIECARALYSDLRGCDDDNLDIALFVLPPATGIGRAVRDRLTKAAAPRTESD